MQFLIKGPPNWMTLVDGARHMGKTVGGPHRCPILVTQARWKGGINRKGETEAASSDLK